MSDKHISISFCIPLYNAEKYIEACILSIVNQNLDDYEIICVDDGSSDHSVQILSDLAEKYPAVTVLENESNKGVSFSRNEAIRTARGDFLWFVDSDDLIAPEAPALYLRTACENDSDAVFGNSFVFGGDDLPNLTQFGTDKVSNVEFTSPKQYYPTDQYGKISYGIWNGIFRRSSLMEHQCFFREELKLLEDVTFLFEFGMTGSKVTRIDHLGYYYRMHDDSTIHRDIVGKSRRYFEALKLCLPIFENYVRNCDKKYYDVANAHFTERKIAAAGFLIRIRDSSYVRKEIRWLKKTVIIRLNMMKEQRCTNARILKIVSSSMFSCRESLCSGFCIIYGYLNRSTDSAPYSQPLYGIVRYKNVSQSRSA